MRPVTPYQYPAVHDMPPARPTAPMNEDEQYKLENELRAARDRQEAREGQKPGQVGTAKKTAPASKSQSSNPIIVPPAGVKTNP